MNAGWMKNGIPSFYNTHKGVSSLHFLVLRALGWIEKTKNRTDAGNTSARPMINIR